MNIEKNLFSSVRFRQILNDLKRRPEDAARELNISLSKIKKILNNRENINLNIATKIMKIWPIQIGSLINHNFSSKRSPDLKIFTKEESIKTSRIIKRNGNDYYEYRDTAMEKFAPFRPEWIRTICKVSNNNPNNKKIIWNKGHLLHQFTYFVGNINFYYIDSNNKKKVGVMKTGDSMYISPYIPHSFASRDNNLNFIIALTYLDKVTPQLQDDLSRIGEENIKKILINTTNPTKQKNSLKNRYFDNLFLNKTEFKNRIKTSKNNNSLKKISDSLGINLRDLLGYDNNNKVSIKKNLKIKRWFFPEHKRFFYLRELASSKFVSEAKSLEIEVLRENNFNIESFCHQYAYVLSDKLKIKKGRKIYNLSKHDTFYIKPFTKFSLISKKSKVLILRIPGTISGDNLLQLSQIGKKNIGRVINENKRWY